MTSTSLPPPSISLPTRLWGASVVCNGKSSTKLMLPPCSFARLHISADMHLHLQSFRGIDDSRYILQRSCFPSNRNGVLPAFYSPSPSFSLSRRPWCGVRLPPAQSWHLCLRPTRMIDLYHLLFLLYLSCVRYTGSISCVFQCWRSVYVRGSHVVDSLRVCSTEVIISRPGNLEMLFTCPPWRTQDISHRCHAKA